MAGKGKDEGNPFAALAALRDALPAGPEPAPAPEPRAADQGAFGPSSSKARRASPGPARAVVRYERKGRGGKEVTVIEHLGLAADALDAWARELKRDLGTGGHVDGAAIVLAGDQRPRLPALLAARGVRKVTTS